jgi:hypothetical protein
VERLGCRQTLPDNGSDKNDSSRLAMGQSTILHNYAWPSYTGNARICREARAPLRRSPARNQVRRPGPRSLQAGDRFPCLSGEAAIWSGRQGSGYVPGYVWLAAWRD